MEKVEKKVVSAPEAAKILNVTPVTIRRWLKDGILIGDKLGGRWLITIEEVQNVIDRIGGKVDELQNHM